MTTGVKNPYARCQVARTSPNVERGRTLIVINPYLRQVNFQDNNQLQNNNQNQTAHQDENPLFDKMAQSQWRKSSISGCKQKASLFRGPRTYTRSPSDTYSQRPCKVCKVKEHNNRIEKQIYEATQAKASQEEIQKLRINLKNVPHRAHIHHCPQNKNKNKKQLTNQQSANSTLGNHGTKFTTNVAVLTSHLHLKEMPLPRTFIDSVTHERWKATPLATELRNELERRMGDQDFLDRFKACRAPLAVAVLVEYIDATFQCRRPKHHNLLDSDNFVEKYDQYRRFFQPGSIAFTFPPERRDRVPFPQYHAIEDITYLNVDWTMSHPEVPLYCVERGCNGRLVRDRYAFQKSKTLLPIINQEHHCIWANVMKYLCDDCNARCAANDGRLLATIPAEVARCYPVKPRYCGASNLNDRTFFQLSVELSEDLEDNILTYANAGVFSRKIWKRVLREYERRLLDYFSISKTIGKLQGPYISLFQYRGKFYAPSADQLYDMYHSAERSTLTTTGVSEYDRHRREVIGIGCKGLTAIDWTFNVCNNYALKEKGASSCFTMNNDAGQIAAAFLVPSTKVGQVAHGVRLVSRRSNFNPKVIATDTWPAKLHFWFSIFGNIIGMLGIFHFIKRITETMRISNYHFHHALHDLKECIYQYDSADYGKLIEVLKKGIMSHSAQPMTDSEIEELQKTSKWSQRYSRFLRKRLNPATTIEHRLNLWVEKYKSCIDPITGQHLFAGTQKAVDNQIRHTEDIQWPRDIDMYVRIPPGQRATHGLDSFQSRNPEPQLESFHSQFANFGNNRMSDHIGDDIHLRGIANRNLKIQHEIDARDSRIDVGPLPAHLADVPLLQDHHLGQYLNMLAKGAGCKDHELPFQHLNALADDSGETFLSEYFHAQMKRNVNIETRPNAQTDLCACCIDAQQTENVATPSPLNPLTIAPTATPTAILAPMIIPSPTILFPVACSDMVCNFCCEKFAKYNQHKTQKGRYPPGRVPHDHMCTNKIKQKQKASTPNNVSNVLHGDSNLRAIGTGQEHSTIGCHMEARSVTI